VCLDLPQSWLSRRLAGFAAAQVCLLCLPCPRKPSLVHHIPCSKRYLTSPTAPDAMDQMKKAFKGLFKKKPKKEEPTPTTNTDTPSGAAPAHPPASETTPPAPAPATAPEPAKTEATPGTTSSAPAPAPVPAQPVPASAPAQDGANKDEVAALAEVKRATQSRSTSHSTPHPQLHSTSDSDGSRWRHRIDSSDDVWRDPS
jgi:hypothetical protein